MKLSFSKRGPRPDAVAGFSVIDSHTVVRGDIETEGTLRVEGKLDGSILRGAVVIIGAGASVRGNVDVGEAVIAGSIEGNVAAQSRIELESSAIVHGDLVAGSILVHEGAQVRGRLYVRPRGDQAHLDPRRPADDPLRLSPGSGAGG
jgi:cytoskeletal protein CcmA (bactofilin family)